MTEQARSHRKGVLKRPRTVFLGDWNQDELKELSGLVGEDYHFNSFEETQKGVALGEVDLIVARRASFLTSEPHSEGVEGLAELLSGRERQKKVRLRNLWHRWARGTFFVYFGGHEILPADPTPEGTLLLTAQCQHRELLVTNEDGELQDLSRIATKDFKNGRELAFWRTNAPALLETGEWLVQTDEGGAPAFHRFDEKTGKGMLILQEPLCRAVTEHQWLAAVLRLWHEKAPNHFPDVITWEDEVRWQTTEEKQITEQLTQLDERRKTALAEFSQQEADLKASFERAKSKAEQSERRLLTTQGDELVEAVAAALIELGFVSSPPDDEGTNHKKEDLLVTRDEWPEWEASIEVKGKARSGAKGDEATKLGKRRNTRGTQQAILFVNGEFSRAPNNRGPLFSNNQEIISMVKVVGVLVVDTRDLYQALFDEHLRQELVSAMRSKVGAYPNHIGEPEED